MSLSPGVYRALLLAYPREFREEYGEPMTQLFRDQCRDEWRHGGPPALVMLWLRTLADLAATAWQERFISLWHDIRYSLRLWRKNPGFVAVAVLSLALGIGANTTMFSGVSAVMYRTLPFPEPDRLVMIEEMDPRRAREMQAPSIATAMDWRRMNHVFEDVALAGMNGGPGTMTGAGPAVRVREQDVTPNVFDVLRVKPLLGRALTLAETRQPVKPVLISHEFWTRQFGGDAGVLEKRIELDGRPFTIVGVLPPRIVLGGKTDFWCPVDPTLAIWNKRTDHWMPAIARLKPGVTLQQASADMNVVAQQVKAANRGVVQTGEAVVWDLHQIRDSYVRYLFPMMGAVGLVLFIACANVAGLLLARAASREKEVALRLALGARRGRILRQLLVESTMLGLAGGGLGLVLALAGNALYVRVAPAMVTQQGVEIDHRVLLFTLVVSVATGMVFGLAPAVRLLNVDLNSCLKEGSAWMRPALRRSRWLRAASLRNVLVAGEVALALTLVTGTGLILNSVFHVWRVDPGFDSKNVLTMEVLLAGKRYWRNLGHNMKQVSPETDAYYQAVTERVRRLPGVEAVATTSMLPLRWLESRTFTVAGRAQDAGGKRPETGYNEVTPAYFSALRIPLKRGRLINEQDRAGTPWVLVVNERFARMHFPGQEVLGREVVLRYEPYGVDEERPRTIVGVVGDVRHEGLLSSSPPCAYASFWQQPRVYPGGRATGHLRQSILIRTTRGPESYAALASAVRHIAAEQDRNEVVDEIMPMNQVVAESLPGWEFVLKLLGVFASIALFLAAIGTYGMVSYSVTERTHDIGVRVALGAMAGHIRGMVLRQGLVLAGVGIGLGVIASLGLMPLLAGYLFEVQPTDPLAFGGAIVVLLGVALAASYLPARRAMAIDPVTALRQE